MYNDMSNRYLTEDLQYAYPFNWNSSQYIKYSKTYNYYFNYGESISISFKLNDQYKMLPITLTLSTVNYEPIISKIQWPDDAAIVNFSLDESEASVLQQGLYHCSLTTFIQDSSFVITLVPPNGCNIQIYNVER